MDIQEVGIRAMDWFELAQDRDRWRVLVRSRRRWEDNIKMDLQEVGIRAMDWFELAQDKDRWRTLVSALMNLQVP